MELDVNKIVFEKATLSDVDKLLHIIYKCMKEVNSKDYEPWQVEKFLNEFTTEWLKTLY